MIRKILIVYFESILNSVCNCHSQAFMQMYVLFLKMNEIIKTSTCRSILKVKWNNVLEIRHQTLLYPKE